MSDPMSVEEIASTMVRALNTLGHAATDPSGWTALRERVGDEQLRRDMEDAARRCLELARFSQQGPHAAAFPRAAEAEGVLLRMLELLPYLSLGDESAMADWRAHARRMFSALGVMLPE